MRLVREAGSGGSEARPRGRELDTRPATATRERSVLAARTRGSGRDSMGAPARCDNNFKTAPSKRSDALGPGRATFVEQVLPAYRGFEHACAQPLQVCTQRFEYDHVVPLHIDLCDELVVRRELLHDLGQGPDAHADPLIESHLPPITPTPT